MSHTSTEHRDLTVLLRRIGEAVSGPTSRALKAPGLPEGTTRALTDLENLGLQLQSLGRVAAGKGRMGPERIDLGQALMQLRAEWYAELQRRGASFDGHADSLEVRVCAGVFKQAADLAIGHALSLGQRLHGSATVRGQPPLPTLEITIDMPGQELFGVSPEALDELHWSMLAVLCAEVGVRLERQVEGREVVLRLGFVPEA
jgi:hypothetical protein